MAAVAGIMVKGDRYIIIKPTQLELFEFHLIKEHTYWVGIDQSTTCTGIFMIDADDNMKSYAMLDIKREGTDKEVYFRGLHGILNMILTSANIKMVVAEEPFSSKFAPASSMILKELKGKLMSWFSQIPQLRDVPIHTIYPQTWKSKICEVSMSKNDAIKYSDAVKDKKTMASLLCRTYPLLQNYLNLHFSTDCDGFDACGIILGYILYSHTKSGMPRICGIKEQRHASFVGYAQIDKKDITGRDALCKPLGEANYVCNPVMLAYNTDYNRHDNIRMASSNWDAVVTVLPAKQTEELCWRFGFTPDDSKAIIMFVFRKGKFRESTISAIKYYLPANEEVR